MNPARKLVSSLAALCFILSFLGCATTPSSPSFLMQDLLGPEDQDDGFIVVRLRIRDASRRFALAEPIMRFENFPGGISAVSLGEEEGRWLGQEPYRHRGIVTFWKSGEDANYFDQYFHLRAKPGRYFLKDLRLFYSGLSYFQFPLSLTCQVQRNGLVVMGTVDLDILQMTEGGGGVKGSVRYQSQFLQDEDAKAALLERFKARYPALAKQHVEGKVPGAASFGIFENFTRLDGDRQNTWWYTVGEKFSAYPGMVYTFVAKEPNKELHGWAGMREKAVLPRIFTLRSEIRWVSGMRDAYYGVRLGMDEKNVLYAGISAEGDPIRWIKKDGEWLAQPVLNRPAMFRANKKEADEFFLDVREDLITFRINGEEVGTFPRALDLDKVNIGFFVAGTQEVAVDSLVILGTAP